MRMISKLLIVGTYRQMIFLIFNWALLMLPTSSLSAEPVTPSSKETVSPSSLPSNFDPLFWFEKFSSAVRPIEEKNHVSTFDTCNNFYQTACSGLNEENNFYQVTPLVKYFSQREHFEQQHRLLLDAIKERSSSTPSDDHKTPLSDFLVQEALDRFGYTDKIKNWKRIFPQVQKDAIAFFRQHIKEKNHFEEVTKRVHEVHIDDNYLSSPQMIFTPNVTPSSKLLIGGGLLDTINNQTAIFYVLAHELGHVLNSDLRRLERSAHAYKCMQDTMNEKDLRRNLSTMEIEAEWFAHQLVSIYLNRQRISHQERVDELKSSIRFFCGFSAKGSRHPSGPQRIYYFSHNPVIQKFICSDSQERPVLQNEKFPVNCY